MTRILSTVTAERIQYWTAETGCTWGEVHLRKSVIMYIPIFKQTSCILNTFKSWKNGEEQRSRLTLRAISCMECAHRLC